MSKKFEELKENFAGLVLSDLGLEEIKETENILIQNNGTVTKENNDGYIGKRKNHTWYTAKLLNSDNEIIDNFDFFA